MWVAMWVAAAGMFVMAFMEGLEMAGSCTSKILGDKNWLHNAVAPQLPLKIRL
jgi:hypothetical protein